MSPQRTVLREEEEEVVGTERSIVSATSKLKEFCPKQ